jgi:hypothetical protein
MIDTTKSRGIGYSLDQWKESSASRYGTLWVLVACLGALAILFFSGCSGSSHAHDVDPARAKEALKTALERWKNGEDPGSLAKSATPMTVQDFDWMAGAKLMEYQIVDDGKAQDANLRVRVKLTLSNVGKGNGKVEKAVWYLVGTSPSVTVFRDMLHK